MLKFDWMRKSMVAGGLLVQIVSCSNDAGFESGTPAGRSFAKSPDKVGLGDPTSIGTTSSSSTSPTTNTTTPDGTLDTSTGGSATSSNNPITPVTTSVPTKAALASCQILASSYRLHQDGSVQIGLYGTNAVSATLQGVAVPLDAQQHAALLYHNVVADTVYSAVVKNKDGKAAQCSVTVLVTSKWYKASNQVCSDFCKATVNGTNIPDPQGSRCVSGENYFAERFNKFINQYPQGKWGGGYGSMDTSSVGGYCYAPAGFQKRDNDKTDITVGCYCQDSR